MAFEIAPQFIKAEKPPQQDEKQYNKPLKIPEKIRNIHESNGLASFAKYNLSFPRKKFGGAKIIPINKKICGITDPKTGKIEKLLVLPSQQMIKQRQEANKEKVAQKLGRQPTNQEIKQVQSIFCKDLQKNSMGPQDLSYKGPGETNQEVESRQQFIEKFNKDPKQYISEYNEKREEIKKITKLQKYGIIIIDEKNNWYINQDKIKDTNVLRSLFENERLSFPARKDLFLFLANKKAKKLADKDNPEIKPQNIFYLPESIEEAFNPNKIKEQTSLLDSYQFLLNSSHFPIELKDDHKKVNSDEIIFAKILYKDLKAYRDKADKLWIYDKKQKQDVTFSSNKFYELTGISFSFLDEKDKQITSFNNPIEFFTKQCPNLLKSGILKISDISKVMEGTASESIYRIRRKIHKKGSAFIAGVKVYLGSQYEGDEIVKLSKDLYGIVRKKNNEEKILATVNAPTEEQIKQKKQQTRQRLIDKGQKPKPSRITQGSFFKVGEVPVRPYKVTERSKKFEDESPEEYAERIKQIKNFHILNKLSNDLTREAQIGLHNLTLKQQEWLTAGIDDIEKNYDDFINFAKKYGLTGLKSFLSLELDKNLVPQILAIGEKLPSKTARAIFDKYSQIIDQTENVKEYLMENFKKDKDFSPVTIDKITQNLLKKGKDLLEKFADQVDSNAKVNPNEIIAELEQINADILLFAGSFKELKKQDPKISLEDFKNTIIENIQTDQLSKKDKQEMIKIADRNWSAVPHLHKKVIEGLQETLDDNKGNFYLVQYNNELLGFVRFEKISSGKKYGGSLNINTDIRGSKIGESIMQSIVAREAQTNIIEATAYPKLPIATRYIGEFGFVVTDLIKNYEGTGKTLFKIERDDKQHYENIKENIEQIKKEYFTNKYSLEQPKIILSFDLEKEYEDFLAETNNILKSKKYAMVQYKKDPKEPNVIYAVFEKKAQKDLAFAA